MKSVEDIIDDVGAYIRATALLNEVTGRLYTDEERPINSKVEDIVVGVLANHTAERQQAYVNVNVFFADQYRSNQYKKDRGRSKQLCRECLNIFEDDVHGDGFWLHLEEQTVLRIDATNEHMVNNRLLYEIVNE